MPRMTKKGPITYVAGKDASGNVIKRIDKWNQLYPDQKATFLELPDKADQQRQQMIQNAQIKSDKHTLISMDVVWTAEFAANGIVDALPEGAVDPSLYVPATVDSATYFNKLYAYPDTSDAGLLYYRKDLLDAAGLEPPKTWDELKAACDKIKTGENADIDCFAGQYDKYEGLTVQLRRGRAQCRRHHRRRRRQAEREHPGGHEGPGPAGQLVQGRHDS